MLLYSLTFDGDLTRGNGAGNAERASDYAIVCMLFIQYPSSRK